MSNTEPSKFDRSSELNVIEAPIWKIVVAFGLLMSAIGFAAMSLSWVTAIAIELLLGVTLLTGGLIQAIYAYQTRQDRGAALLGLSASFFMITGFFLLTSPIQGVRTISLMLAILFVIEGIGKLLLAVRSPQGINRQLLVFDGLIAAAIGTYFAIRWPEDAAWMIGLLVGIRFLLAGLMSIAVGYWMRQRGLGT